MENNQGSICKFPQEEILYTLFKSHIGNDAEVYYVAGIIWSHLRNTHDIIPLVTEHRGLALASRSFVSLGFFKPYMEHLNKFHGFPNPRFYFEVCQLEFRRADKKSLAGHLETWLEYIQSEFHIPETELPQKSGGRLSSKYSLGLE